MVLMDGFSHPNRKYKKIGIVIMLVLKKGCKVTKVVNLPEVIYEDLASISMYGCIH